ncbi:protein piccolo-like [Saccostrea cucullata]|uniref:protein piccolo-like n=1 Tax=Saccostrea cuccullata TaxID=36930 RepID=UPI002ED5E986
MEELLNLDNLSQEEKDTILGVLQKDEMVRKTEDKKICQLKAEIQAIRMKSVLRAGDDLSKMCARCHAELGRFFNRGDLCPKCRFRVCNMCKENLFRGQWLCVLCYKQRQLKFFTGDLSSGQLSRWPSGADLVKASIHKMSVFKGASSDSEILDSSGTKDEIRNGKPLSNGSVQSEGKDKKHEKDRVEFPQESDQRKLNQLFDAFRVPKTKELSSKSHSTVRKVTSKKYEESDSDSDSSVSTDTEKNQEEVRKSLPSGKGDSVDSASKNISASSSGTDINKSNVSKDKNLQRNFSDDSVQTLVSDEVPFSKSSTETQIKVDVHSDESNSPPPSVSKPSVKSKVVEDIVKNKSPKGNQKQTATEMIMAMKSTSPSLTPNQNHQSNSHHVDPRRYEPGRSPSPYSFDSIPSSHANSPLPVKKRDNHVSRESSDTDSTSRMSTADYSGTESSHVRESSSGAEDYVVEELSKVRFRRMSKNYVEKRKTKSPPPGCDPSVVGVVREGQLGNSPLDISKNISPSKSPQVSPQNVSQKVPDHHQFVRILDTSDCEVPSNVSSDLSLFDIERDCHLDPEVYDISDLAKVSRSILTQPQSDLGPLRRKKSPRPQKKERQKSASVQEQSVSGGEGKCVKLKQEHVHHIQNTNISSKQEKNTKNSKSSKVKPKEDATESGVSKKLIMFNPDDLESDSTDSNQEMDLKTNLKTNLATNQNMDLVTSQKTAHTTNQETGEKNLEEVDEDIALDDSGKHDSFDSLLESSLFQNFRLSSIDDRQNRFESIESFNLSPLTPLSDSKIGTKPQTYTFAFVNDSVWTNESLENVGTPEEDFDEIFNKAVTDLESSEPKRKPVRKRRKKSFRPSTGSNRDLEEIAENVEDSVEENTRSFQKEFGEHHEFRFSVDDSSQSQERNGEESEDFKEKVQKANENESLSSLWRFEDDSLKDEFQQVFGSVQESPQKQTYAQNRAFLRKTFATSTDSLSTESDALSVIQEENNSSDNSNEDLEVHLHDIKEEEDTALLTECAESNVEEVHVDSQNKNEIIVDDSEGIDENIILTEMTDKMKVKVEAESEIDTLTNTNVIVLDPSLNEQSSTDYLEEEVTDVKDLNKKDTSNDLQSSPIHEKEENSEFHNTQSSLGKMLLTSSKIAMMTLQTSESPADKSVTSTENLVSSLEAEVCLDEEDSQASEDLLLQQIIQSQNNREDNNVQDSSPNSQTEKVRKRTKSKQLVQEWLQTDVPGEVMGDVPADIPSPLMEEWLLREGSEGVVPPTPAPALAPLSRPISEGGQKSADSYPSTVPFVPILQIEEHSEGGTTRLSPRASSEGSGSFEDSGHVSGASTENTPEHRRTDSTISQLSVPSSTLSTVTDRSSEDTDIDDLVASHRCLSASSRGNLLSTIADSRESILSFYSNAGEVDYGKIPVTGEICFGLEYNYRTGTLEIQIKQCKGLAPADTKRNRSDPYVKTYLLPDKTRGGKRKTRIMKNTLNPVFEQTLRYLISKSELENRTLWVTVWHNDRFGRNDFLGEVTINFDYFRFSDSSAKWYPLQERIESQPTANLTYKGDLFLSMKFVPPEKVRKEDTVTSPSKKKVKRGRSEVGGPKGQLHVLIKEARNLSAVRSSGFSDPFVKGYLLPDKQKGLKQKTSVVKRNCNPQWNHTFMFDDVSKSDLKERCLELTVWDHDKLSSNEFLGGLRFNLGVGKSYGKPVDWMDAHGEEISMWQAMLDRPNIWIDCALMLRPNMDKRKY